MNNTFFRIATIYFIIGIAMGIGMAATDDFTLRPVHAHVNLLGWVSLALFALFYKAHPEAARTRLAKVHFWAYNVGLPVQMIALALFVKGNTAVLPVLGISSIAIAAGALCFVATVWRHTANRAAAF